LGKAGHQQAGLRLCRDGNSHSTILANGKNNAPRQNQIFPERPKRCADLAAVPPQKAITMSQMRPVAATAII
jgi:hypothetical protein